jgi:hypothetical protein
MCDAGSKPVLDELLSVCSPSLATWDHADLTQFERIREEEEAKRAWDLVRQGDPSGYEVLGQLYKENSVFIGGDILENSCREASCFKEAGLFAKAGHALMIAAYHVNTGLSAEDKEVERKRYVHAALSLIEQGIEKGQKWDAADLIIGLQPDGEIGKFVDTRTRERIARSAPDAAYWFAKQCERQKDFAKAIEFYEIAEPYIQCSLLSIAEIHLKQGDLTRADAAFKRAIAAGCSCTDIPYGEFLKCRMNDLVGARKQFESARDRLNQYRTDLDRAHFAYYDLVELANLYKNHLQDPDKATMTYCEAALANLGKFPGGHTTDKAFEELVLLWRESTIDWHKDFIRHFNTEDDNNGMNRANYLKGLILEHSGRKEVMQYNSLRNAGNFYAQALHYGWPDAATALARVAGIDYAQEVISDLYKPELKKQAQAYLNEFKKVN